MRTREIYADPTPEEMDQWIKENDPDLYNKMCDAECGGYEFGDVVERYNPSDDY